MFDFILISLLWIFALYGIFEFIRSIIKIVKFPNLSSANVNLVITVKDQENTIEALLNYIMYNFLYNDFYSNFSKILIVDLGSSDNTLNIIRCYSKDYSFIKALSLEEYKDSIQENSWFYRFHFYECKL